jgi:endonuclease III
MSAKPTKAPAKKSAVKKAITKKAAKKAAKAPIKRASQKTVAKNVAVKPISATRPVKPSEPTTGHGVAKLNTKPDRVAEILKILHETYPSVECALVHANPFQLLVATILSAQCTDVRVNMVTPKLFETYPTPAAMATAPIEALEALIRTTGFYHNKAKSIQGAGRVISQDFHNEVPQTMAELLTVPGAARKTASVVLGVAYGKAEGVVVDTHVYRLSRRLGLSRSETAANVEQDLMKVIPKDRWIQFSHELIHHGRMICEARKPKCAACPLEQLCQAPDKTWHS